MTADPYSYPAMLEALNERYGMALHPEQLLLDAARRRDAMAFQNVLDDFADAFRFPSEECRKTMRAALDITLLNHDLPLAEKLLQCDVTPGPALLARLCGSINELNLQGHSNIITMLLQRTDTDINCVTKPDSNASLYAGEPVEDPADITPLMHAAYCFCLPVMHQLLNAGADPTLRDTENNTALHYLIEGVIAGNDVTFYPGTDAWIEDVKRLTRIMMEKGLNPLAENTAGDSVLNLLSTALQNERKALADAEDITDKLAAAQNVEIFEELRTYITSLSNVLRFRGSRNGQRNGGGGPTL